MESKALNVIKGSVAIFVVLFILSIAGGAFGTINAGERGVLLRLGKPIDTLVEGLYFKIPLIDKVISTDVKIRKVETSTDAASKDLQTINSVTALNYMVDPTRVLNLYKDIGVDYENRVIIPALQESIKTVTAQFTAEELIAKRADVSNKMKANITSRVKDYGILISAFNIINFNFSPSFNEAVENKVTAEQNALAAKNKLEQVKFEAEQRIQEAQGKAKAMSVEADALRNNPDILQLRALEKWNGVLPQVTGSNTPFINIK